MSWGTGAEFEPQNGAAVKSQNHRRGKMKFNVLSTITTLAVCAVLLSPVRLPAQAPHGSEEQPEQQEHRHHRQYNFVDLGTFDGPASAFNAGAEVFLNNQGMAVGAAEIPVLDPPNSNGFPCGPGSFVYHAFEWRDGVMTDLGALPGVLPVSGKCSNAEVINERGDSAGNSEIDEIDPVLGLFEIRAVLWKDGRIVDLGTLPGGTESAAHGINNREQVAGISINDTPDPYSFFFPLGQTRAFLWERGVMRDLGTLGGPDAQAFYLNDRGQVAGVSYTSFIPNPDTGVPPVDPFLWENGKILDLGTLGGTLTFPTWLNKRGQVVGVSNLEGDQTHHPFLWDRGRLIDLGTLGGDNGDASAINDAGEVVATADLPGSQNHHGFLWRNGVTTDLGTLGSTSVAQAINSKSQVVGHSRIGSPTSLVQHAFLWANGGPMIDLNTLIPSGSSLLLVDARNINDRGEIAGVGLPPSCGDLDTCGHAYVLIPCDSSNFDTRGCEDQANAPMTTNASPANQHGTAQTHRGAMLERMRSMRLGVGIRGPADSGER
jgi:probable HAF family extracellular repeat protein